MHPEGWLCLYLYTLGYLKYCLNQSVALSLRHPSARLTKPIRADASLVGARPPTGGCTYIRSAVGKDGGGLLFIERVGSDSGGRKLLDSFFSREAG